MSFESGFETDGEEEAIEKNAFEKMEELVNSAFNYRQCTPSYIDSINPSSDDYKSFSLQCGLKLDTPKDEIAKAQMNVSAIIDNIDKTYIQKFYRLQNLINDILKFVGKYHVLYVHTTNDRYKAIPINEAAQKEFLKDAGALDDKITSEVPTAQDPILRIVKEMKFNKSVNQAQKYIKILKEKLTEVYRTEMADIFKYIVLGEEV